MAVKVPRSTALEYSMNFDYFVLPFMGLKKNHPTYSPLKLELLRSVRFQIFGDFL